MNLTALALVRIDSDVIEEFVRHTLRFVDRIIIVDNASLDSTPRILAQLSGEGLPLIVWRDQIIAERPSIATDLARRAFAEYSMDYLLLLDADEFIEAPSRDLLEGALSELPAGAHASVPWRTYVPIPEDDPSEARVLARIRHRRRAERIPFSKVFLSSSFAAQAGASIAYGNHHVDDPEGNARTEPLKAVALAHFPVRSLAQIQCKALLGWSMFLAMGYDHAGALAYHWRRMYEKLKANPDWRESEFYEIAWHYLDDEEPGRPEVVFDPIPPAECRYSNLAPSIKEIALAFCRQLERANAVLLKENRELLDALSATL